jgi:RNA ligase (TIGR02306 family)
VSDLLGITHYDPDAGKENTYGQSGKAPRKNLRYPRTFTGWCKFILSRIAFWKKEKFVTESVKLGIGVYDVDAFKNYPHTFIEGEEVIITCKIHGSNWRGTFVDDTFYVGSRTQWKAPESTCIFRKVAKENPWIEDFCRRHEGYVLRGEVTPTQGKFDYGKKTPQLFVFDVQHPDGYYLDDTTGKEILDELREHWVPTLYRGPFNLDIVKSFVDGPSVVSGAKHIREGIVIRTARERHQRGVGRCQLKIVSNLFLDKDK